MKAERRAHALENVVRCPRCDAPARRVHRPLLLRAVPFAHLFYCWGCHRRFVKFVRGAP